MKENKMIFMSTKPFKKTALTILLIAVFLTSCAPSLAQNTPTPPPVPQPTSTTAAQSGMDTLPVARAKSFLADKLNISNETIQFVETQAVQWPDSCLGVQQPGIMCAMHVVDGYRVTLSANDQTYEVRSNLDGSQTVLSPDPASMPKGNANE